MDNLGPDIFGRKDSVNTNSYSMNTSSSSEYNAQVPGINPAKIKVIGVGGGGGSAVNRMIKKASKIPNTLENLPIISIDTLF